MSDYLEHYREAVLRHLKVYYEDRHRLPESDEDGNVEQPEWRGGNYNIADRLLSSLANVDTHHVIYVEDGRFTIEHPIGERLRGTLKDCEILKEIQWAEYQLDDGRYKAYEAHQSWELFPIEESK